MNGIYMVTIIIISILCALSNISKIQTGRNSPADMQTEHSDFFFFLVQNTGSSAQLSGHQRRTGRNWSRNRRMRRNLKSNEREESTLRHQQKRTAQQQGLRRQAAFSNANNEVGGLCCMPDRSEKVPCLEECVLVLS